MQQGAIWQSCYHFARKCIDCSGVGGSQLCCDCAQQALASRLHMNTVPWGMFSWPLRCFLPFLTAIWSLASSLHVTVSQSSASAALLRAMFMTSCTPCLLTCEGRKCVQWRMCRLHPPFQRVKHSHTTGHWLLAGLQPQLHGQSLSKGSV